MYSTLRAWINSSLPAFLLKDALVVPAESPADFNLISIFASPVNLGTFKSSGSLPKWNKPAPPI